MTPADVARAYFNALQERRFADATQLVDPHWLARWRERHLAFICAGFAAKELERSSGRKFSGFGSDGVLRPESLERFGSERLVYYPAEPTLADLAGLAPANLLALVLQTEPHELQAADGTSIPVQRKVIGEVGLDERRAYVVYIEFFEDQRVHAAHFEAELPFPHFLGAYLRDGTWRIAAGDIPVMGPPMFGDSEDSDAPPAA
jgi:hypothetical protein